MHSSRIGLEDPSTLPNRHQLHRPHLKRKAFLHARKIVYSIRCTFWGKKLPYFASPLIGITPVGWYTGSFRCLADSERASDLCFVKGSTMELPNLASSLSTLK